jgi:hypothetical protein
MYKLNDLALKLLDSKYVYSIEFLQENVTHFKTMIIIDNK